MCNKSKIYGNDRIIINGTIRDMTDEEKLKYAKIIKKRTKEMKKDIEKALNNSNEIHT